MANNTSTTSTSVLPAENSAISGRVTLNGVGLPGVFIGNGTTDPEGYYTITGLASGSYTLTPALCGYTFNPPTRSVTAPPSVGGVDFDATALTYSIAGSVKVLGVGLGDVTVSAGSSTTTTDPLGNYTLANLAPGLHPVTPSKAGYSFSPANSPQTIVCSNITGINFDATALTYTISGSVQLNGSGLPGVTVTAGSASALTDGLGTYTLHDLSVGSHTVTPSLFGYTFSPPNSTQTITDANIPSVNFDATVLPAYILFGVVKLNGSGLSGVTVTAGTQSAVSDSTGAYAIALFEGTYLVTPALCGYTFNPPTRSVQVPSVGGFDFDATALPYSIAGTVKVLGVGLGDVTVSAGSSTTTTDPFGNYTLANLAPGHHTVTPSKAGYTFLPASSPQTIVCSNITGINFDATALTYTISGSVQLNGSALLGVTVTAGSASALTDGLGTYTLHNLNVGSYTVTPSLSGYTFSPPNSPQTITNANIPNVNFNATALPTYTLSGVVTLNGSGLSGITVTAGTKSAVSGPTGAYSITGLLDGTYTVIPSGAGFAFSPKNLSRTILGANVTGVSFAATALQNSGISGVIRNHTVGLAGVTVSAGGKTATTSSTGAYAISRLTNGTYLVIPSLAGYTFDPPNASVSVAGSIATGVDFSGSPDK